ncbi:oxygen-insensitive NADPH nitroreductase [Aquibacillus kalidii]|uniref:oxygen-insensitive NADPH nitroreductase n=1 Tax=Aquibacillus kalidii TaxID=2762597 RepID=UPI00164596F5|nr:oxygen-insensitive NADPH nitroreductase [Aquibacillus kalidii]
MNTTIETILNHRSIRKFTNDKVSDDQLNLIVEAASKASTSSYLMAYSIISVTDEEKKKELAQITNQPYVQDNGHLLLFCADLYRNSVNGSENEYEEMTLNLENTEHLLVSTIDAALAAQNATIAAESLGLGICYIGSIRNNMEKVDQLFHLPKHVIPLFGLAIGTPDHNPDQKPRLPKKAYFFENEYPNHDQLTQEIEQFDSKIAAYYKERSFNQRQDSWSAQMTRKLTIPTRMDVTTYVQSKQFNKR